MHLDVSFHWILADLIMHLHYSVFHWEMCLLLVKLVPCFAVENMFAFPCQHKTLQNFIRNFFIKTNSIDFTIKVGSFHKQKKIELVCKYWKTWVCRSPFAPRIFVMDPDKGLRRKCKLVLRSWKCWQWRTSLLTIKLDQNRPNFLALKQMVTAH